MDQAQVALPGMAPSSATPVAVARVLVDVDLPHLDHPLDYSVPEDLVACALPGRLVRVRLAGRKHLGWIVERASGSVHPGTLQPLLSVVSDTVVAPPRVLGLARYVADRFAATQSQVLSLAVPARHAATERAVLAEDPEAPPPLPPPDPASWSGYEGGAALLGRLAAGQSPRAVWTAVPTTRDRQLVDLVLAARASGRSVVVVVPTRAQVVSVHALLDAGLGPGQVVATTAEDPPAARYRTHLEALLGRVRVVVGTRSAVWTPVVDLGLVVVWDDGDDHLVEQRAPRVDALDVAVARAHLEGAALVAGAHARSTKAQALVRAGWAVSMVPRRDVLRASTARVVVPDDLDREREGPAAGAHLPPRAQQLVRRQLAEGPVLVQVPMAGYVPVVSCERCRHVARCAHCSGPLSLGADRAVTCAWCGRGTEEWRCPLCAGTRLRAVRVGSDRTGEELGRAFPGVPLTISSSTHEITRRVGPEARLVVATPGAEPAAEGGYAGALILDAAATAGRPELWAPEEALRRWFNALALVRPQTPGVVLGVPEPVLAQTLVRWDPADFADRSYDERVALGFFPAATVIALDGPAMDVDDVAGGLGAEVMGTVPRPSAVRGGTGEEEEVRTLVRTTREGAPQVLARLREVQQRRAARRQPLVRVTVNPPELF